MYICEATDSAKLMIQGQFSKQRFICRELNNGTAYGQTEQTARDDCKKCASVSWTPGVVREHMYRVHVLG